MTRGIKTSPAELALINLPGGGTLRRDPNNPRYGWITCPDCPLDPITGQKKERYRRVPSPESKAFQDYTGRCDTKNHGGNKDWKRYTKDQFPTEDQPVGKYDSFAYWSKCDGVDVPVKCGVCKITRNCSAYSALQPNFTGLHKKCFLQVSPLNELYTLEILFPAGTKALMGTRAPDNRHMVGIECRGCFKDTRQIKYVYDKTIQSYLRWIIGMYALLRLRWAMDARLWLQLWPYLKRMALWSELCSDCSDRGETQKLTGKYTSIVSGTVTYFSKVDDDGLPLKDDGGVPVGDEEALVSYEEPVVGCGCKRRVNRDSAVTQWKNYPTVCRFHHSHPEDYYKLLEGRKAGNGNEQKNGTVEKQVDRKQLRREQWLLEAVNKVIVIWDRVRHYNHLSRERWIGQINQAALADELGVGNNKTPADAAKQIANRLAECGVRGMFPGEKSWYECFRVTVIEGYERGLTSEEIVSSLRSRSAPSRSAA